VGPDGRPRGRGQRAHLVAEDLLAAARDIVDREGADRLTLRRLAERVGVAPNAIYTYFTDKSALIDAVLDSVLAEVPSDSGGADWREALAQLMRASRFVLLAHGGLLPYFLSRPMRGPNAIRLGEATLQHLARAGVEGRAAVDAMRILLVYTFGFAAQEVPRRDDPHPMERETASREAFRESSEARFMSSLADPLSKHPGDSTFEAGLAWLLDGIVRGASSAQA
jgi:AcrR family transcriptional regulator